MPIQFRSNAVYDLVAPTSMGIRLTPTDGAPMHLARTLTMQATSAESNVATVPAYLGLRVKVLTAFVKGSPIAQFIRDDLASRHLEVEGPEFPQGGPWGYRHQFNLADTGAGARGPRVHNDRAGEVGRELEARHFDLDRLFARDGVRAMHLSGLFAALSPKTAQLCLELARRARAHGTRISFDLNYRESFWKGREAELRAAFTEIAGAADILVGNEEDFQLALGVRGPEAGGQGLAAKIEQFKGMIARVRETFPNASVFGTTLREVLSVSRHLWGAILAVDGQWHVVEPREIEVRDRIGGGDGFVGGLLYAMLRGWPAEQWIQFGWATGALAVTSLTDYAQPADEEQVWSIWKGNARVRR